LRSTATLHALNAINRLARKQIRECRVDGKFRPGQEWKLDVQDEQRRLLFSINITSKKLT